MVVPEDVLNRARELLKASARPLFLHDDDGDGVTSFVLLYQFCNEGKGYPVKNSPVVSAECLRRVEEYQPDLIVILDKPRVDEEFFAGTRTPILWIDHHEPQAELVKRYPNVMYLNPRVWDDKDNRPTSYWAYRIAQQNLWIAAVGNVSDWYLPDYLDKFKEQYPDLLPKEYHKVEDLYLDTPIGLLVRVLQFNLKGTTTEVRKSILTLTRVTSPYEILMQTTTRGKFLWKKYLKLAEPYEIMLKSAREAAQTPGPVLLFLYEDNSQTFTTELSNELLIRYPERIILVARRNDGKMKCSVRSKSLALPPIVNEALTGLNGRGGGHTNACGILVDEADWAVFYERFTNLVADRTHTAKTSAPAGAKARAARH